MRTLFLTLTLIILTSQDIVLAQSNSLNATEYANLKFDNVAIQNIIDTNGNQNMMQALFDNSLIVEKGFNDAVDHWIKFTINSMCIEFYNGIQNGSTIKYDLASIDFENSSPKLSLKNKVIKIGDNVNTLSNFNSRTVNGKKIYTFDLNNYDTYVFIYVSLATNKIVKIGYNGNLL